MRRLALLLSAALLTASIPATSATAASVPVASGPTKSHASTAACPIEMPAGATCGYLTVPTDWDLQDDTRTMSIAYAVHRATGKRLGALTYNMGGPGNGGVFSLPMWIGTYGPNRAFPPEIVEHYDIVAWDPRGVDFTTPHLESCDPTFSLGPLPQAGPVDWLAAATNFAQSLRPQLQRCLADNPDVAPYLGTYYVIRDLDALRSALGYDTWSYYGISYGTTIGMAYARQFPDRLDQLVLDGVAPPNQSVLQSVNSQAWAWTYALRQFIAAYGAQFSRKVSRVLSTLDRGALVDGNDTWTRFSDSDFDYTSLESLVKGFGQVTYDGKRQAFAHLYQLARTTSPMRSTPDAPARDTPTSAIVSFVLCADRSDRPTPEQVAPIAQTAAQAITPSGTNAIWRGLWCSGLPAIGHSINASNAPILLRNSALLVNSSADPQTPWLRARLAASTIAGSRLITYTGTQHGVYRAVGSACVDDLVTRYLMTTRLPKGDPTCPLKL